MTDETPSRLVRRLPRKSLRRGQPWVPKKPPVRAIGPKPQDTTLRVLTPGWAEDLMRPARYKGAYGGRGSGKSHWFATMVVLEHVKRQDQATVCVREVQTSLTQSVKRLIELKIRDLHVDDYFDIRLNEIRSRRGNGIILFRGMSDQTAESIKSLEGFDRAWEEEAQSISQRSLDLLRPTIRKEGSEIWFTWNPHKATDPVDALLRGPIPLPDAMVVRVNYNKNPWVTDALKQEIAFDRKHNYEKYLNIWEGEYAKNSEARVFKN